MRRRPVSVRTWPLALALAAAGLVCMPGRGAAQRIAGQVIQLGWGEPVGGALVVLLDGSLAQVDSALTDGAGVFVFPKLRPGTYHLQASADGEFSTLSDPIRLTTDARLSDIMLVMPSALMTRATACLNDAARAGRGVLVGVAYELTTRSPLPGAVIQVAWQDSTGPRELEVLADARGRYSLCDMPAGRTIRARVVALGRSGAGEPIEIEAGTLHRADLALSAATAADLPPRLEILERHATGDATARITGRLIDQATNQPVPAAVVAVPEAGIETLTDGGGRFRLERLTAAVHMIEVERLGYGEQSVSVEVAEGSETVVELSLAARPVSLPGVSADARRPMLGLTDVKSSRIVAGAEMAAYEQRGASLESVVRERFPIRVQTGVYNVHDFNRRITCMESRRVTSFKRLVAQSDTVLDYPECEMIPVFVDDAPVADPGTFIDHVRIEDYETIVYLAPTEVGMRYGLEGNSSGVLLLYTRGRGPFVDRARNVR